MTQTTFAICALSLLTVLQVSAGNKPKKARVTVVGVITSKTKMGDQQFVDLKDKNDQKFTCFVRSDIRFKRFHAGDQVVVGGRLRQGSTVISPCHIVIWTSK